MQRIEVYTRTDIRSPREKPGHIWYLIAMQTARGDATAQGREEVTATRNRAELTALIKAMQRMIRPCEVHVYTDSSYLASGWESGWIEKWEMDNWMTAKGTPVKNVKEWKELRRLTEIHLMVFHTGEKGRFGNWMDFEEKRMETDNAKTAENGLNTKCERHFKETESRQTAKTVENGLNTKCERHFKEV